MSSAYEIACSELRASLMACFGQGILLQLVDGSTQSITGYVKTSEVGGHTVKRLLTDANVPVKSSLLVDGVRYVLTFNGPQKSKGGHASGLIREYVLMLESSGEGHGWSEYGNGH
ncbi:MAG: hypothetical protein CENE_03804 [Candidatus Celerinatantimonas neptuna]|nr:MAG: hypothetical protein CENE_03804 [Candidatus Celerinatantimonas neptuna]